MPSNRRNTREPLDTEVSQKLEEFEYNFCKYVDDAMPKKFHDTFVRANNKRKRSYKLWLKS